MEEKIKKMENEFKEEISFKKLVMERKSTIHEELSTKLNNKFLEKIFLQENIINDKNIEIQKLNESIENLKSIQRINVNIQSNNQNYHTFSNKGEIIDESNNNFGTGLKINSSTVLSNYDTISNILPSNLNIDKNNMGESQNTVNKDQVLEALNLNKVTATENNEELVTEPIDTETKVNYLEIFSKAKAEETVNTFKNKAKNTIQQLHKSFSKIVEDVLVIEQKEAKINHEKNNIEIIFNKDQEVLPRNNTIEFKKQNIKQFLNNNKNIIERNLNPHKYTIKSNKAQERSNRLKEYSKKIQEVNNQILNKSLTSVKSRESCRNMNSVSPQKMNSNVSVELSTGLKNDKDDDNLKLSLKDKLLNKYHKILENFDAKYKDEDKKTKYY
jgi:hypothetical protein